MVGIYKITNKINGKIYVGQSINIQERWNQHKYKAQIPSEKGYNSAIHVAFRKYGIDNFIFEVIEECDYLLLDERERYWIRELDSLTPNGYNILIGGQKNRATPKLCIDCGKPINKEAIRCVKCAQLKQSIIYNKITGEEFDSIPIEQIVKKVLLNGFASVGREFGITDNAIRKRFAVRGIPKTKKELLDWYENLTGERLISKINKKPQKRAVVQYNKEGEYLREFESCESAARYCGAKRGSHITEACQGKISSAYGYFWKYKD